MIVYDSQGRPVSLGDEIGHGGEATVYHIGSDSKQIAKIYQPEPRPNYPLKLAWMVEHPPANPTEMIGHASLAWPGGLLYDKSRRLKGYTMPLIQHAVPLLEVFNPRRRAEVLPQFDRRYLHRTARNLAAAISALHRSGYVAGDVNESNVLVTPTALVTIIDTDSFQVTEDRNGNHIIYHCPVGKPEYTPPELQGKSLASINRNPDHDNFGLAVLIFQLLMEGSHPFRAQWLGKGEPPALEARIALGLYPYSANPNPLIAPPKRGLSIETLHPHLVDLFHRCFVDGARDPRWRPSAELWVRAITDAEHALVCCAEGHYYSGHLEQCPYCALKQKRVETQASKAQNTRSNWPPPPRNWAQVQSRQGGRTGGQPASPRVQNPAATQTPNPAVKTARPQTAPRAGAPVGSGWPSSFATAGGSQAGAGGFSIPRGFRVPQNIHITGAPVGVLRSQPLVPRGAVKNWVRLRVQKSFAVGGAQGALAGAIPGAAIGLLNWANGDLLPWTIVFAIGGVLGGLLRGWKPGHRVASVVSRYLGWKRFWEILGAFIGGAVGTGVGLIFIWAIIPVFLGLILGVQSGLYLGRKIYGLGSNLGWERIWGVLTSLGAGALGYGLAALIGLVGVNAFGNQLADALLPFSANGDVWWAFIWVLAGSLGGALAGGLSGVVIDIFGRLSGLVD